MKKYVISLLIPECERIYLISEKGVFIAKKNIVTSDLATLQKITSNLNSSKIDIVGREILNIMIRANKAEIIEYEVLEDEFTATGAIYTIRNDWEIGEDGIYNV